MSTPSAGQTYLPQETELYFQALLRAMHDLHDVVFLLDPQGRYLEIAPIRPEVLYRPVEETLGKTINEVFPPEQAAFFQQSICQALSSGQVVTIEYALPIGGRETWFEGRLSPVFDEQGKGTCVLAIVRDITEPRRAAQALRESESLFRNLLEQSNDTIYMLRGRRFEFVNRRFEEIFGVSAGEATSPDFDFMQLVAPKSRPLVEQRVEKLRRGETIPLRYEFTALTGDGREIEVEASVSYIPYRGEIVTQGILRDITERKRAEQRLRQRERYLACLSQIAEDLLTATDPFSVLPSVLTFLGVAAGVSRVYIFESHRDAEGRPLVSQRYEWCAPGIEAQIDNPALQNVPWSELAFRRWLEELKHGRIIAGQVADLPEEERVLLEKQNVRSVLALPLFVGRAFYGYIGFDACGRSREWEDAELDLLTTAARDVSQAIERRQTLLALEESEQRYRRLVDLLPDGIAVHQDGLIRMANWAGARMLGYDSPDQVIGVPVLSFVHPEDRPKVIPRIQAQLEQGLTVPPMDERFLRRDGSVVDVEAAAGPFILGGRPAALVVIRDATARKRLEEQLRQALKMEAVGRLAGGVAHDFNNLLTAINGYAEFILNALSPEDPIRQDAEAILKAGARATTLTRQLLAFSRRQVMEMKVVNLNQVLDDLGGMLRRIIGEDVELTTILSPDLGSVRVDPAQIEQVVVNLAVNARDALPSGGKITLETANVALDQAYSSEHPEVVPGEYVLFSVSDTGVGISAEVQRHLFEPFFTTKEVGEGTGLGLAMVYGIVRQSGGHIHVYSELGHGTMFKIYLPRWEVPAEVSAVQPPAEEWPRGEETLLVVEDSEMVRDLAARVLREQGYTVLEARQGPEALHLAEGHAGPIHLLLTDVVMPQMSGRALHERLRHRFPGMQVLYMSGYTDNVIAQHGILEPAVAFIQKPFTPQMLARKVRETLDRPAEGRGRPDRERRKAPKKTGGKRPGS